MKMGLIPLIITSVLSLAPLSGSASESAPKKPVHTCKKTDTSVDALACNIYKEARGETISGQMAIGFVTLNRLKNDKFPPTVGKIVYQKSQFTWTGYGTGYKIRDEDSWKVAKDISKFLYSIRNNDNLYARLDPTYGATFFHTKGSQPYWRTSFKKTVIIGDHVFYKFKEAP